MNKYIIDLQTVRTDVLAFLNKNKKRITLYSENDTSPEHIYSIATLKEAAKASTDMQVKDEYIYSVGETADLLVQAIVHVALKTTFISVPESYYSVFNDLITKLTLPNKASLYNLYIDQDDDDIDSECVSQCAGVVSLDDAMVLFDDLYILGLELLADSNLNPNNLVEFSITGSTLILRVGNDYRLAVFNQIFKDGWKGPMLNADGALPSDITSDEIAYVEALQQLASI